MYDLFQKSSGFSCFIVLMLISCYPFIVSAQSVQDARKRAEASAKDFQRQKTEDMFGAIDVEALAYPDNKQGCAMKSAMFVATLQNYKAGDAVEEVASTKIFQPLIQTIYDTIRKKGIEKATLDNMKEYQNCLATAKPFEDAGREYDVALVHGACKKLNAVILDTLSAIKQRKRVGTVMHKYERQPLDLTGTAYEGIDHPAILFIGQLYQTARTKPYQDVVALGSNISIGCSV